VILATHGIFTAYGFWLPNDPRGSWSEFVRSWELARCGKAIKINTTQSVAGRKLDRELRSAAKGVTSIFGSGIYGRAGAGDSARICKGDR
jgi:hypothetical protein